MPFSPQTLTVKHGSGEELDNIVAGSTGWYSHTVTFPPCTGGGMIINAAPGAFYTYFNAGGWYSKWPMLDNEPDQQDPFGMDPSGTFRAGAYGFNQDCN